MINNNKFDVYHLYTVYHKKKFIIKKLLEEKFKQGLFILSYSQDEGIPNLFKGEKYDVSVTKSKGIFSLPLYPELSIKDVKIICKIKENIINYIIFYFTFILLIL